MTGRQWKMLAISIAVVWTVAFSIFHRGKTPASVSEKWEFFWLIGSLCLFAFLLTVRSL